MHANGVWCTNIQHLHCGHDAFRLHCRNKTVVVPRGVVMITTAVQSSPFAEQHQLIADLAAKGV